MTGRTPEATTDKGQGDRLHAATVDPQDPLPESNWIPRRWSSFVVCLGAAAIILITIRVLWLIAQGTAEPRVLIPIVQALSSIAGLMVAVIVIDRILLMVAPSAEQAIKMIQTAGLLIRGVTLRSETRTTATADAAETVTRTSATPAEPVPTMVPETGEAEPDPATTPGRD